MTSNTEPSQMSSSGMLKEPRTWLVIELVVITTLVSLLGWMITASIQDHEESVEAAEQIAATKTALLHAAMAMEQDGSDNDGFYREITLDAEDVAIRDYKLPDSIAISVKATDGETYCLQATNGKLVGSNWRTATYKSSDQSFSADDQCE
jgi:Tfp pilus assembly protein PilE